MEHQKIIIFPSVLFSIIFFLALTKWGSIMWQSVNENDIVTYLDTTQGKLQGSILQSRGGRNFYSFRGIPYAEVSERFQPSTLKEKWEGVRNAQKYGAVCPHLIGNPVPFGSEDCLFINVFSPNVNHDANLNVMVFIHGGGFQFGDGNSYSPEYFMDEDVILVTINYRLGVLGFLSTGDDIVSGNNGMKDQVVALQWVKKHIRSFGGSPEKVTLFGNSAGGASVDFHMMSKLSQGLFHRGISLSGSALNPWATQKHPAENAMKLGKRLNCSTDGTMKEMVECIKGKDLESILRIQDTFVDWFFHPIIPMCTFAVVVESKSEDKAFLTDTPFKILKSGSFEKVPYMTGITSVEGVFFTAGALNDEALRTKMNENFDRLAPASLMYTNSEENKIVTGKLKEFYLENKPLEVSTWGNYNDLYGDRWINNGVILGSNLIAHHTTAYRYVVSYDGGVSAINTRFGVPGFHGVGHVDELMYLFQGAFGLPRFNKNSEAGKLSVNIVKSFVEFAKTGIAKTWGNEMDWKPINPDVKNNLWYNIKAETELEDIEAKFARRLRFWEGIFPEDEMAV